MYLEMSLKLNSLKKIFLAGNFFVKSLNECDDYTIRDFQNVVVCAHMTYGVFEGQNIFNYS